MTRRTTAVAAIIVAALAAVAVLSAITIQSSYESNLATERSRLLATARVTAELMSQQVSGIESLEQATLVSADFTDALNPTAPGGFDVAQMQPVLDQLTLLRSDIQFAAVADAKGTTRVIAPTDPTVIGKNFAFRDWYQGVMRTNLVYVSTAYVSAIAGHPLVVAVAAPIWADTGQITGVLFTGYKIGSVQAFTDRLALLEEIDLQLTDQKGVIMARQGGISGHLVSAAQAPDVAAALSGRSGSFSTDSTIAASVPVGDLGWTVSASTPIAATAAASQRTTSALIAAALFVVLVFAGVALILTSRRLERATARHVASETELRTVHHALTEAIQVFDAQGNPVSGNRAAERIFDVDDNDWTPSAFDSRWEAIREDGTLLPDAERPVAVAMRTGEPSERVVMGIRSRTDQQVKWLSVGTSLIRNAHSEITGYVCGSGDITERIQTIRELGVISRASHALSSSLNADEVVRALTTAAAELCSAPGEPQRRAQLFVVDGPTVTLTGEHDPAGPWKGEGLSIPIAEHPYIERVLATGEASMAEINLEEFGPAAAAVLRNAQVKNCVWVPLTRGRRVTAVLAVAGRQHRLINSAQLDRLKTLAAIGELALSNAAAHDRAAALARTDPLTGIGNRRAFDDRLNHLPRLRFAVVAIDVDNLKTVNDAHGHEGGDELLVRTAAAMQAEMRPGDLLARTGGDEFLALLLDCEAAGALRLSRRLADAVSTLRFPWGTASISVGTAAGGPGQPPDAVVKEADQDLYAAKSKMKERTPAPVA